MSGLRVRETHPTNTGVYYAGPGSVSVQSQPVSPPRPGEVVVEVAFCGVCGTDATEFRHGPLLAHISSEPHPVTGHSGSVVLGHEFAGHVVAAGEGVQLASGTLVACSGSSSCGSCAACLAGDTNLCPDYHIIGLHRDGGLASYCTAPASACIDASGYGVPPSVAALAQPMAIAIHALRRGSVSPGGKVAVVGIGGVGAFLLYAAVEAGGTVTAIDTDPERLGLARTLDASDVFMPGAGGGVSRCDVVFEVSGTEAGLGTAISTARPGGRIVLVGLQAPSSQLPPRSLVMSELSLIGSFSQATARDLPEAIRVLATRVEGWRDVAPLAFPLSAVVEECLSPSQGRRIKTLFAPGLMHVTDVATADRLIAASHTTQWES